MKPFNTFSAFLQMGVFVSSILFVVPLSLGLSAPALLFLWLRWLFRILHPALLFFACLMMGLQLALLLSWPLGGGVLFFSGFMAVFSWLRSSFLSPPSRMAMEVSLVIFFLLFMTFSLQASWQFFLVQGSLIAIFALTSWWKRRWYAAFPLAQS